jgi:membrane fusion protein, multidrug efflux system
MSATLSEMSVQEARRWLSDTSRLSSQEVDAAQGVVDRFFASRQRNLICRSCGAMRWVEHEASDGEAVWACASCHWPPALSDEEWAGVSAASQRVTEAAQRAMEASQAAADPRAVLREALERLAAARAALSQAQAAVPAARQALDEARERHTAAEQRATEAKEAAVTAMAKGFLGQPGAEPPSQNEARAELAAAVDGLEAARAARQEIDGAVAGAKVSADAAATRARKAAAAVIAREQLEGLLGEATTARDEYCEAIGKLGWLLRQGAVPSSDARVRRLIAGVAGAGPEPSSWPEATAAGKAAMEAAQAALLAEHERR